MNIQSNTVVVNQFDRNEKEIFNWNKHTIVWVELTQRGLKDFE